MKQYEYMVVYVCHVVTGRAHCVTNEPITSYKQLEALDVTVREFVGKDNAIIIDFKLLRVIEDGEEADG